MSNFENTLMLIYIKTENYDHFYKWATKHDKSYTDHVEYSKKFEVFMANKKKIDEHNQKNTQWKSSFN